MNDHAKGEPADAPGDEQLQLLRPGARASEHATREQAEDHRRQRRDEVQRQVAAAVVDERPLPREEVEEPLVGPGSEIRVLVPVRGEAGDVVRPVGADADGRGIESRRRQRIERERGPVADEDERGGHELGADAGPAEQEEEDVAEADLRQHVFEREVGLGA